MDAFSFDYLSSVRLAGRFRRVQQLPNSLIASLDPILTIHARGDTGLDSLLPVLRNEPLLSEESANEFLKMGSRTVLKDNLSFLVFSDETLLYLLSNSKN